MGECWPQSEDAQMQLPGSRKLGHWLEQQCAQAYITLIEWPWQQSMLSESKHHQTTNKTCAQDKRCRRSHVVSGPCMPGMSLARMFIHRVGLHPNLYVFPLTLLLQFLGNCLLTWAQTCSKPCAYGAKAWGMAGVEKQPRQGWER